MNARTAKQIGGKIALKVALFAFLIFEIIALFVETRGDFANGILFYLQGQLNPFVFGLLVVLLTSSYLLGKKAGKEILVLRRSYISAGFRNAGLAGVILLSYLFIVGLAYNVVEEMLRGGVQIVTLILKS